MAEKLYRIYCEICGYSKWSDGTDLDNLRSYKRSPISTGIPKIDPVTKKTITKPPMNLPKQFKCPHCGRVVTPRKYPLKNDMFSREQNEQNDSNDSRSQTSST